jgi:hypothetical protein
METKNKKRVLVGIILLLLLINLSAIITIGYNRYERNKYQDKEYPEDSIQNNPHHRLKLYVKKELKLSDNQFKKYCQLKDENFRITEKKLEKIRAYKKQIISEINKEAPDSLILMMLSDSIGEQHRLINIEMNHHFLAVKQLLEPYQQVKLNELLLRIEERFNHRGKRPSRNNKNEQEFRHRHRNKKRIE